MTHKRITPIILAGGSGTRLWPLSRENMPKQFCAIEGEKSLFQKTLGRVANEEIFASAIIVCSHAHHSLVSTQIMGVGCKVRTIALEPEGRDTAAAIALAVQLAGNDAEEQFLVMPSDHEIHDIYGFNTTLKMAQPIAADFDRIVTLGVTPAYPETGYGYIRAGQTLGNSNCSELIEFIEKPDESTAELLIQEKNIFWNAGMFFFTNSIIRTEFLKHAAGIFNDVSRAVAMGKWQGNVFSPDANEFLKVNALSIDYAVMEKTEFASVAPLMSDWSDMGSWNSVWDNARKDESQNAVKGTCYTHDTKRCYVKSDGPTVGVCGLEDVVVVANRDAVLVTSRENPQGVKHLVEQMKQDEVPVVQAHSSEARPWGSFESLNKGDAHQVKHITVKPDGQLSLQYHFHRAEHWIVVKGIATVTVGEDVMQLSPGQQVYIPQGAVHRLENFTDEIVEIIEVQYGTYFGEDDIVRVEDVYARPATEKPSTQVEAA